MIKASPFTSCFQNQIPASFVTTKIYQGTKQFGRLRESNPGPPAPEAGIMPLDQGNLLSAHVEIKMACILENISRFLGKDDTGKMEVIFSIACNLLCQLAQQPCMTNFSGHPLFILLKKRCPYPVVQCRRAPKVRSSELVRRRRSLRARGVSQSSSVVVSRRRRPAS
jgi:hypothetical protein